MLGIVVYAFAAYVMARSFSEKAVPQWMTLGLVFATAAIAITRIELLVRSTRAVAQWDFVCFWLYGHAVTAHANVYAPATYHALALPVAVDAAFRREVLDVGFPYPPPSIFLFWPIGYFHNLSAASVVWLSAMLVALAIAIVVVARGYARGSRSTLVAIVALALVLPATGQNIALEQTNFLAVACLAVAFAARRSFVGGVAAAFAVVVKPYLLVVVLWLALRRRWNALLASIATLVIASLASIPLLGPGGLRTFLTENPSTRLPSSVYAEGGAASLYAFLLKLTHKNGSLEGPVHDPIFVAIAVVLAGSTVWLAATAREADEDLALASLVGMGLMLYPGSWMTYVIALLPALVALGLRARSMPVAFAAMAAAFFIGNAFNGNTTLVAIVVVWLVLIIVLAGSRFAGRDATIIQFERATKARES